VDSEAPDAPTLKPHTPKHQEAKSQEPNKLAYRQAGVKSEAVNLKCRRKLSLTTNYKLLNYKLATQNLRPETCNL
jgi:hypothetical protein